MPRTRSPKFDGYFGTTMPAGCFSDATPLSRRWRFEGILAVPSVVRSEKTTVARIARTGARIVPLAA